MPNLLELANKLTKPTDKKLKKSQPPVNPITFVQEVGKELNQVTWPTRKEAIKLTTTVIAASLIVGAYIGGLDYFFTQVMAVVIK